MGYHKGGTRSLKQCSVEQAKHDRTKAPRQSRYKHLSHAACPSSSQSGRKSRALILSKEPDSTGDVKVSNDSTCTHLPVHDAVDPIASEISGVVVHSDVVREKMEEKRSSSSRSQSKSKNGH